MGEPRSPVRGDDKGSAGHGSSGSTNLSGSRGSRASTRDPLTHISFFSDIRLTVQLKPQRQFNSVVSAEYFVAVMVFDFESTSTETAIVGSHDS